MIRCKQCGDEKDSSGDCVSCLEYEQDEREFTQENAGDFAEDKWFQSEQSKR